MRARTLTMGGILTPTQGLTLLIYCLALATGCGREASPDAFVARVGEAFLLQEEVNAALEGLPYGLDSVDARRLFVDQWVTNELLYQEALRRNLRTQETVQRRLAESERAVLIDALVSQLFSETAEAPGPAEIRAYFEVHQEQLRLREPFVRVRYLLTTDADSARQALRLLQRASATTADSVWNLLATSFSDDPALSRSLAANYVPESRLFLDQPMLREPLATLSPRQIAPLIEAHGHIHLLQLVDRVPTGTLPELPWVENQVERQLTLDARKQMYERQVQRLRTEALSRNALVLR